MIRRLFWLLPLGFLAVMFYYPLMRVIALGLSSNFLEKILLPSNLEAIWFTLWLALLSTVLTMLVGIPGAYVLYRRKFKAQRFVQALITVPFMLPTIVVAVGFTVFRNAHQIYESVGLTFFTHPIYWITAAHVFVNYSIAVRTIGGVWANQDSEIEEAAELDGAGRFQTALRVSLPQLAPAIFSAAALIFLFCATSFGIPLVLGGGKYQTIETAIYFLATDYLDLGSAAALVVVQTLITASAFLIGNSLSKSAIGIEQVFEDAPKKALDRRDRPAVAVTGLIVIALVAMPMILVLVEAFRGDGGFSLDNFANLSTRGARDLLNISMLDATANSLRNMLIASAIAFVLGTVVSWLLAKRPSKLADLAFLAPLGVSSVVLGFGFLISFDAAWFPLRSSWLIVPLAQALIALPMVIRIVYPALVSLGSTPREQAAVDGANDWQTWWLVEAGMIRQVLFASLGYASVISLGEFGASNFLAYGSQGTIPTLLYRLIARPGGENYGMAMAVSAILILFSFLVVYLVSRQSRTERPQDAA